jgi:hypothetical protein
MQAVSPPPDGGYPNQNTAEGEDALFRLTTGFDNTANGFQALFNNTFGSANTATGRSALHSNTTGNNNTATPGFGALSLNRTGDDNTATGGDALGDENLRFIAQELTKTIRENVTIDWTERETVRAKLRVMVKRILRKYGYPPDKQEAATKTVLEQAEVLANEWAV